MTPQEWRAEVERRIAINEGRSATIYKDSVGVPTIGIGFNLQRDDARSALRNVGASYDAVMAGSPLTDVQIGLLFAYSLDPVISQARNSLVNGVFDALSDARRFVIVDLVFNLGEEGWLEFANTRSLISQAQSETDPVPRHALFENAAQALESSAWYGQVGDRAKRDCAMMRSSDWVYANGDGGL